MTNARRLLIALVLLALQVSPGWAARKRSAPEPLARETAGEGAVRAVVTTGGEAAGIVIWPRAEWLERDLPPGVAAVAARVAIAQATRARASAVPIVIPFPEGLGVGISVPHADAASLPDVLALLARPTEPVAAAIDAALARADRRAQTALDEPLERARRALVLRGLGQRWGAAAESSPAELALVDHAAVLALFERVRVAPVAAAVAGPAGLGARVADALGPALERRKGSSAETALTPGIVATAAATATRVEEDAPARSAAGAAYRVTPEAARALGPALALLFEALRAGEGSLEQRLLVAVPAEANPDVRIEWVADGRGGGLLLLLAEVASDHIDAAWTLIEGCPRSLASLPLRPDAVDRARARLDARAAGSGRDGASLLRDALDLMPGPWPPPDRWVSPPGPEDVQKAASAIFDPTRSARAIAGSLPESLSVSKAPTIDAWLRFGAMGPEWNAAPQPDPWPAERAAMSLARRVLVRLGGESDPPRAFRAHYRMTEETPLGTGSLDVALERTADGSVVYSVSRGAVTMQAELGPNGAEAVLPGSGETPVALTGGRLASLAYVEPSLLAADVLAGILRARAASGPCDTGAKCEVLVAEPRRGGMVQLVVDENALPRQLRVWWYPSEAERPPDELIAYEGWMRLDDGLEVSSRRVLTDLLGASRAVEMIDWERAIESVDTTAPTPRPAADRP